MGYRQSDDSDQIPLKDFKVLIEKLPKEMQLQIECSNIFYILDKVYFQSPLVASYILNRFYKIKLEYYVRRALSVISPFQRGVVALRLHS